MKPDTQRLLIWILALSFLALIVYIAVLVYQKLSAGEQKMENFFSAMLNAPAQLAAAAVNSINGKVNFSLANVVSDVLAVVDPVAAAAGAAAGAVTSNTTDTSGEDPNTLADGAVSTGVGAAAASLGY